MFLTTVWTELRLSEFHSLFKALNINNKIGTQISSAERVEMVQFTHTHTHRERETHADMHTRAQTCTHISYDIALYYLHVCVSNE